VLWLRNNWLNVLMGALIVALVTMGAHRMGWLSTQGSVGGNRIVVFDPVKYGNAQRAVAASLMGNSGPDADDQAMLFRQASSKLRGTIQAIAGNAVVVVKQSIISGDVVDITDAVLIELGLPTNVPSIDLARSLSDIAPTDYTFSVQGDRLAKRLDAQGAQFKAQADQARAQAGSKVVP